ncbi:50S ribosomal protein L9 [Minwuia thermotolerans]|uniref:Large ribosomal subunit protein bL9 n=1 Tax=Minwuia thermotolerans TaxID=2056226 RepID=A0A2M9G513_9PROT|nr:50S ribosomal protein L9 [Minwuia thermotolerans]PJK30794.1 50S ribosomal protein L9 [Minwuia thermotolerans]
MKVILLERIDKLGQMGDVVTVKNGYARNFLLPHGKAQRATDATLREFQSRRKQLEAKNLELRKEAEDIAGRMKGLKVTVIRQSSDSGQLYGSVNTRDITDGISEAGFTIERRQVQLTRPIKTIGVHDVTIRLHPEVMVDVGINVARSEDEAAAQLRGENVFTRGDEDEEEYFDVEEAAEEIFEKGPASHEELIEAISRATDEEDDEGAAAEEEEKA